ncbi:sialic acid synthase, partial [Staphylococcus arlettae]
MTNINNYNDLNIQLTPEEASAYTYLSTNESQWADKFKSAISLSRDKITQRLVASMYRENLANCYNNS